MDWLTDWITDWIKQGLIDAIMDNFAGAFDYINEQVGGIAANVGQTPEAWNYNVIG